MILHPNSIYFVFFILLTQSGIASVADNIAEIPRFTDPAVENDSSFGFELLSTPHPKESEWGPSYRISTDLNYFLVDSFAPRDYLAAYHADTLTFIDEFSAFEFTSFDAYQLEENGIQTLIFIGGYHFLSKPCPSFPDFHTGYAFLRIWYGHSNQLLDCEIIFQTDNENEPLGEKNRTIFYGGRVLQANATSQLMQGVFLTATTNQYGERVTRMKPSYLGLRSDGFDTLVPQHKFSSRPISCQNEESVIQSVFEKYDRERRGLIYNNTFVSYKVGDIEVTQLNTTGKILACKKQTAVVLSTEHEFQFLNLSTMTISPMYQWDDLYNYADARISEKQLSLFFMSKTGDECKLNFVNLNRTTGDWSRSSLRLTSLHEEAGRCPGIYSDLIQFNGMSSLIFVNEEFHISTVKGRELMPSSGAFGLLTMGIDSDSDGVGDASDRCPNSNRDRCLLGILT